MQCASLFGIFSGVSQPGYLWNNTPKMTLREEWKRFTAMCIESIQSFPLRFMKCQQLEEMQETKEISENATLIPHEKQSRLWKIRAAFSIHR